MVQRLPLLEARALAVAVLLRDILAVAATTPFELGRLGLDAIPDRVMELGRGWQTATTTAVDATGYR